jgi:hypothetical protein
MLISYIRKMEKEKCQVYTGCCPNDQNDKNNT